ncbi:glycosyltransferase [Pseudarthrobacter sp. NIBRBAC000502771]|uniref:glycosyltransferase n=1 Tax=Pseudarthrobacter sp. NIBRBAC000502771 TaxID=2590774 RepID=UPI0011305EE7|nr:glycosyltransferase [Pseudarthrobacter sp. NIBRBAC000502771]QDG62557.1 glycosyltransferase [Pseudarthrobacter sp. NIBRBAC000502771]
MRNNADWTLITVTYNNAQELRNWWAGVDTQGAKWIVVDNNSTDDTADFAASLGAEIIRLSQNVGFSRANNVGLGRTRTKYVAFINPDVSLDAASLQLLGSIASERDAVVCPQLVNPDGTTQANGRGIPFLWDKLSHRGIVLPGSSLPDYLPSTVPGQTFVAWAMGAAVCGETNRIRSAGGWDERYFLYYEDHAFGLNAWERGQEVIVVSDVLWTHAWKRETKGLRLRPWLREIASASRFYSVYPHLLLPPTPDRRRKWQGTDHKFGKKVHL